MCHVCDGDRVKFKKIDESINLLKAKLVDPRYNY